MTVKAQGLAYDPATRDWTKPVSYEAKTRIEAIRWINCNADYLKDAKIVEAAQ